MSECDHHWHVNWFDKFQEVIQCCHCGTSLDEGEYDGRSKNESCGDKVRSRIGFTPPVHVYVTVTKACPSCEGDGSVKGKDDEWEACVVCDGKGRVSVTL